MRHLLFAVLLLSAAAHAQTACPWDASCLTWTDTVAASFIASYKIEMAPNASSPWTLIATVPGTVTSYQRSPVTGTNLYRVTRVMNDGQVTPSNTATDVTAAPAPAPILTVAGTGYRQDLSYYNTIKISAVGIVPINIPCKADSAMGLNVIADRNKLLLDPGKKRPNQVLAKCRAVG